VNSLWSNTIKLEQDWIINRNMSDEKEAVARTSRQRCTKNMLTQGAINAVDTRFKRKRSGNGETNEKLKQLVKNEKRNQQLEQIEISESVIPSNNGPLLTTHSSQLMITLDRLPM